MHSGKIAIVGHDIGMEMTQAIAKMGDDVVIVSPEQAKTTFPLIYHHGIDEHTHLEAKRIPPIAYAEPGYVKNRAKSKHHNRAYPKRKKPGKKTHRKQ
jgi:hypothetical protein